MLAVFDLIWWGNTNHGTGIGHAAGDDTIADLIGAVNMQRVDMDEHPISFRISWGIM